MIRILILCEGKTETEFVSELLVPHFSKKGIAISFGEFHTSKLQVNGSVPKGGLGSYQKVKDRITKTCKHDHSLFVTTMIDFYGLPDDFTRIGLDKNNSSVEHAIEIEKNFKDDVNCPNFIANFIIHEFEALLFSKPSEFIEWYDEESVKSIQDIADHHETPEHINSGIDSSPSKRLKQILHSYDKAFHGPMIASQISLETICQKCPHFNGWITQLENLITK